MFEEFWKEGKEREEEKEMDKEKRKEKREGGGNFEKRVERK